ncbi:MAG TPA: DUF167 family protein [Methylocella sp.]|nr:DUF167 family protein [Methylocella sp.]
MSALSGIPWTSHGSSGLLLSVRLTPKSPRDEITGVERLADGSAVLKVRVRAVPEQGKANEALLRLISSALRIPLADVRLKTGTSGRLKTLCIEGDPDSLAEALSRLCQR